MTVAPTLNNKKEDFVLQKLCVPYLGRILGYFSLFSGCPAIYFFHVAG